MKLQVSLSSWIQNVFPHHFLCSFDSPAPVSCWLEFAWGCPISDFFLSRWAPVSWMLFRRLFFHRHTPDWPEIPNFVKRFPNSFARARAIPDMDLLSPLESLHSKSSSGLFSTWRFLSSRNVWVELCCWLNAEIQSQQPTDQEQVTHPYAIQHPKIWLQILYNCAKPKFVSCTSNWLGRMFYFPKNTRHLLRLILSPQDHQQSLNLETNLVHNAVPCFFTWQ